jgi:hypothetical protein
MFSTSHGHFIQVLKLTFKNIKNNNEETFIHHQESGTERNVSHPATTRKKSFQDDAGKRRYDKRIATILIYINWRTEAINLIIKQLKANHPTERIRGLKKLLSCKIKRNYKAQKIKGRGKMNP